MRLKDKNIYSLGKLRLFFNVYFVKEKKIISSLLSTN